MYNDAKHRDIARFLCYVFILLLYHRNLRVFKAPQKLVGVVFVKSIFCLNLSMTNIKNFFFTNSDVDISDIEVFLF
jgi:hypothetical protein